jgi:peptidoglycan/xylan/chitin deacetylase (PgdA/CDA1 family)
MIFRKAIGWGVAQFYKLNGTRSKIVSHIRRSNVRLPIVFHAATKNEVRRILFWLDKARILPSVELTFDDGWLEFLDTVKVLEEFNIKATLFIAPREIQRGRVWTDGLTVPQRQSLYSKSEDERIKEVEKLIKQSGRRLMNEAEVKDVARHPLVNIGNHTWSHLSCPHRPF